MKRFLSSLPGIGGRSESGQLQGGDDTVLSSKPKPKKAIGSDEKLLDDIEHTDHHGRQRYDKTFTIFMTDPSLETGGTATSIAA